MKLVKRILFALICVSMIASVTPVTTVAQDEALSPEQQLAERYVPIAYLRYQEQQCGVPPYDGEPYLPLPVEMVIGNERVLIRDGANNDEVVTAGPTAQELATFGPDTYMDFPGDPRRPGCTYENDERIRIEEEGLVPTTYANIIFDPVEGRLALQYWFYWYFNDWNNTHESDWEGIQLVWDDVASVEAALGIPPSRIGYSQHGNGEVADWGDDKVLVENGTHPLVFPAAGSHATFFSDETFLAWGEHNSGFGCDVSLPPSVRTPLDVVVIPNEIDPHSEFAWLLWEGRWGERQPGAFNGPHGPMFNDRWNEPFDVFDTWRPFSIVVPDTTALGPSMAETFCTLTAAGSRLLLNAMVQPWILIPAVIGVGTIMAYFARISLPIFNRARRLYGQHFRLFFSIGLVSLPIGIAFNVLQAFLINRQPLKFVVNWLDNTGGANLAAVMAVGGLQQLAMLLIITPALVHAVREVRKGNSVTPAQAYKGSADRIGVIAASFVVFIGVTTLLLFTAVGFPIAIWLAIKWHFFVPILVDDRSATPVNAFRKSFRLVRGAWWKVFFSLVIFNTLAVLPGIVVGFGLLTLGRTAIGFANGISSLLYAVLMPLSVIAVTLLYLDRRDTTINTVTEEPAPAGSIVAAENASGGQSGAGAINV